MMFVNMIEFEEGRKRKVDINAVGFSVLSFYRYLSSYECLRTSLKYEFKNLWFNPNRRIRAG
jgi:hypothetical protein